MKHSNEKLKILFIGMYPNQNDKYLNTFYRNLIYSIADQGIDCTVVSPVSITKYRNHINRIPKFQLDLTNNGNEIKVHFPRYISTSAKKIGKFSTRIITEYNFQKCALKKTLKLGKDFDVIYGHFILDGGLAAIKIGRKLNLPSFLAYGECDYESEVRSSYRDLKLKDIQGLSGIISVSSKNTSELRSLDIFKNTPIITAPNAIDSNLFYVRDRNESRLKLGIPLNHFIVGFVGGFIERKGNMRLLKAVNMVDNVYVAYAGKGKEQPEGDKVLFCKSLDHKDIPIFLNSVDIFVLPTLGEGSSNAIVEAMACGLPIVSSNLPFNDDILNYNNSIRIDPMSINEIKEAIEKLYSNVQLRIKLSKGAIQSSERFYIHNRASNILDFIEKTVYSIQNEKK